MRHLRGSLAGLLALSFALCGTRPPAASASRASSPRPAAGAQQGDGAASERDAGRALLRQGKAGEALVRLEKALQLFRQANDKLGEASTHALMGDLYEQQGRYEVALGHYQSAYQSYAEHAAREGAQPDLVAALSPRQGSFNANLLLAKIGDVHYKRGDAAQARAAYTRMTVTKPETNALKAAQGGQASAESKAGKLRGFGPHMRGVLSGTPDTSTPGSAAGVITDTVGSLRGPFDAYREAVIYSVNELGLGRLDYLGGDLDAAKKHFENVLAATLANLPLIGRRSRTRVFRAAARTSLGDIALKQGQLSDALKLYADAAKGARADGRLDLIWPAQRGIGRSLWAQAARESDQKKAARLREEAVVAYREALAAVEQARQGGLRADETRSTFLATTGELFGEAAAALAEMALGAQQPAAGAAAPLTGRALEYGAESLRAVERGRARALLDLLRETRANITEGVSADLLQKRQENQRQQEEIAAQLTGVVLSGAQPAQSPEQLEAELDRLQTEFDSIENQIRTASPRYAALTAPQPLTLEEIRQRVLDGETVLLEYSLGPEQSYLYALTTGEMYIYRLPAREAVEGQAAAVRERILAGRRGAADAAAGTGARRALTYEAGDVTSPAAAEYAKEAYALYKTALEPAAAVIKGRRLLVVADGALNYVPFDALVTSELAAGSNFAALPYLLNQSETVFAPSASVVAAIRQQGGAAGGAVLVVADPVFDAGDTRARAAQAGAPEAGGDAARELSLESAITDVTGGVQQAAAGKAPVARLAGTRAEAQQIARLAAGSGLKADTWFDLEASEANVEGRDLKGYRVLHFATHGLLNAERPQFTGVVLSLVGNREGADGFLRTDEVFNLRLGRPLVMLSACETGLGRLKRGEGVIGLTRAFIYAGAPTVGVSLWAVSDRATADLMAEFYKNLLAKGGVPAPAAMRAARRSMIAGGKYSAPFYWAPFVLVGDWR